MMLTSLTLVISLAILPADDVIIMPKISEFDSENNYLATLLHELVHWSGGETALIEKQL